MSITQKHLYAPAPTTIRAIPTVLNTDPKKEKLIYGSGNVIYIRSIANPLECEVYYGHAHPVTVAKFSPSGFYVASGDASGTVRIWATDNIDKTLKLEFRPLTGAVKDLSWDSESKRIIVSGEGKDLFGMAFTFDTGSPLGSISGHSKTINSCDIKPTRPLRIATGGEDFQVNFFQGPPFKFQDSRSDHTRYVNCVRYAPNGTKFISVGSDSKGFVYDGATGAKIGELSSENAHTGSIYSVSWNQDSTKFITASADKTVKLWDGETYQCLTTFTFADKTNDYMQLGVIWAGDYMISVSLNGDINYLDINNPTQPARVLEAHNKLITSMAYSPKTNSLFTGSYDGVINSWELGYGSRGKIRGKGHTNSILSLALTTDSLVSTSVDDTIKYTPISALDYSAGTSTNLEFTPCGVAVGHTDESLAVAVTARSIGVLKNGEVVSKIDVKYQPMAVALSMDDKEVAVCCADKLVRLFTLDGTTLTEQETKITNHRGQVTTAQYSPDGRSLAVGDANREIIVYDAATKEPKMTGLVFHNSRVTSVSWSPDSSLLVSGSLDGQIIIWNTIETSKRLIAKSAHQQGVTNVAFVDESTVVSSGNDCCVRTWNFRF